MLTSNFVFADTRQTTYVIAKINNNRTAYTKIININMLQLKGKPFKNSRLFTGAVISDSVYFEQTSINSNTDVQIHTIVAINETQRIFFLSSFFLPPLVEFNKSETSCLFSNEKTPDIIIMMQKTDNRAKFCCLSYPLLPSKYSNPVGFTSQASSPFFFASSTYEILSFIIFNASRLLSYASYFWLTY